MRKRSKMKNSLRPKAKGILWSCYSNANERPHPYQLMQENFLAYFLAFRAVLFRERVVLGGYISDKFIRFNSRVGQVVGRRKVGGDFADKVWKGFERWIERSKFGMQKTKRGRVLEGMGEMQSGGDRKMAAGESEFEVSGGKTKSSHLGIFSDCI